jgi:uncharacterized protein (DUF4415 family)
MAEGLLSRLTRRLTGENPLESSAEPQSAAAESSAALAEIARGIARQELPVAPKKAAISLRLDADVLDWFRAQGAGYQTRINAILRAYKEAAG